MYYTQTSAFGPAVAGQYRSGIGPRRSGIGSGALRHARIGIKNKSNDDKTTLVAFLTFLLLGGGISASGKFALANISTRNTSADGRELSWCRLWRRWWHRRLSKWQSPMPRVAAGWHRGDSLSSSLLGIHCMFFHNIHDNISQSLSDLCDCQIFPSNQGRYESLNQC